MSEINSVIESIERLNNRIESDQFLDRSIERISELIHQGCAYDELEEKYELTLHHLEKALAFIRRNKLNEQFNWFCENN